MTYEELVGKIQTLALQADASETKDHIAIQFNIYGECEGALYMEINRGRIDVQPYEYFDRHALVYVDGGTLLAVLTGELSSDEALKSGSLVIQGYYDYTLHLLHSFLKKKPHLLSET